MSPLGRYRIVLALVLSGLAQSAANAGDFVKVEKNYKLQLEDFWTKAPTAGPFDAVFVCGEKVCGKGACQGDRCSGLVQFLIGSFPPPNMRGKSQSEFFRDVPASEVRSLAREMATVGAQSSKELSALKRRRFGRNDCFVTEYLLVYKTGASRNMMYALTFHRGYLYQFQFFAPDEALDDNRVRFEQVLSSMEFLEK
jgi:hypothetical protein